MLVKWFINRLAALETSPVHAGAVNDVDETVHLFQKLDERAIQFQPAKILVTVILDTLDTILASDLNRERNTQTRVRTLYEVLP
mmetsp:Transcript_35252/g.76498  ORF Transcript_35252/g.76498 Transcript_35252/m.76498 type:complete len:84 (-) Transcript_35252:2522-2773(-)